MPESEIFMSQKGEKLKKLRKFGNFVSNFHRKKSESRKHPLQDPRSRSHSKIQKLFKNLKFIIKKIYSKIVRVAFSSPVFLYIVEQMYSLFQNSSVTANVATSNNNCHQQDEVDHGEFSCWLEIFPISWLLLHVELQVEIFEI